MGLRRSICYCEPQTALAGETSTWRFTYKTATSLKSGAKLKFDLQTHGRDMDWEVPGVKLKAACNIIYGLVGDEKPIAAEEVEAADSVVPQYVFVLPKDLKSGDEFTIVLGAPPNKEKGSRAQTLVQRRRQFLLYIDPKGDGNYGEPETFSLDVRGNDLHAIRVLAPSLVARNKRFDITVRFEDEYGNLTAKAPEETLIELSYENLRESLSWKLFVPETGFVMLPNLYFNEPGVYRIQLKNLNTGEAFFSPPIKCLPDNELQLFWGLLHGESERVDSMESIETCLRHFRDDLNINFFATSPFDDQEETSNEVWKLISQNVATFNEEDRFATFLGSQWVGESPGEGVRQFVYSKDLKPILRSKDLKNNALKKIYRTIPSKEMISIPSFTMGKGFGWDFKEHNPDFEKVVEIYNAWGSSECLESEGNPRPIHCAGRKGAKEFKEGSVRRALNANCRFGFVAGGLDDRGIYADFFDNDQDQYSPGITAILAPKYSREALFSALQERSCYATTGARIVIGFSLAGVSMGGELSTANKPGLRVNRHLAGYVAGTDDLESVEIIRNGEVLTTLDVKGSILEFTYDDMDHLHESVLPGGDGPNFAYYYLRVIQKDEEIAWSSPIWVDDAKIGEKTSGS